MYLLLTFSLSYLVLFQYMSSFEPLSILLRKTIEHRYVPKCKSSVSTYYVPGSLQTQTFTAPLQSLQFFCTLLLNFQNDKICLCCCVHLSFLTVFKERPFKVSVETNLPFTSNFKAPASIETIYNLRFPSFRIPRPKNFTFSNHSQHISTILTI